MSSEVKKYYSVYGNDQSGHNYKLLIIAKSTEDALEITRLSGIYPQKVKAKDETLSDYRGIIRFNQIKVIA